ncbi:MAG TPA: (d)CMP kinase [Gammaproteobacteria bacterium]|nr:(d)CMP kinase [Gammaproteobacteria bacterium]
MGATAPVICIDGPSGSGKGTISRLLARRLGWHLLDSGALYRLTALAALDAGVELEEAEAVAACAGRMRVAFRPGGAERVTVTLDGRDVSARLREQTTGEAASRVAALAPVRRALLQRQRDFRRPPGLVADGRDMGTTVFPDAPLKIFLTASPEERARRRHKQLMEMGLGANLHKLASEIRDRDRRDATRAASPLRPAADAVELDSTGVPVEQVLEAVMQQARRRGLAE